MGLHRTSDMSRGTMRLTVLLLCLGLALGLEEEASSSRSKRLFFVTTQSTTSTIVTDLTCYATKAALVVCGKRKKRTLDEEEFDTLVDISTWETQRRNPEEEELNEEEALLSGKDDDSAERQGKYLLYWLTKTAVATTSYVNTITLASLQCTPSQFTMSNCASLG